MKLVNQQKATETTKAQRKKKISGVGSVYAKNRDPTIDTKLTLATKAARALIVIETYRLFLTALIMCKTKS
jgi:hypothetical protein